MRTYFPLRTRYVAYDGYLALYLILQSSKEKVLGGHYANERRNTFPIIEI